MGFVKMAAAAATRSSSSATLPPPGHDGKRKKPKGSRLGANRRNSASSSVVVAVVIFVVCCWIGGFRDEAVFSSVMMVEAQFIEPLLMRAGLAAQKLPPLYDDDVVLQEEAWERMRNEHPPAKLRGLQAVVEKEVSPEFGLYGNSTTGIILNITTDLTKQ